MARRLATVYVKTHIRLTEAEMMKFVELFKSSLYSYSGQGL